MPRYTKTEFLERAKKGKLELKNWTPATTIGKFDARFDPTKHELHITVKLKFEWADPMTGVAPWNKDEQTKYVARFKEVCEAFWSDNYTLAADKDDWRDLYARVFVHLEPVTSGEHYVAAIAKIPPGNTYRAMVDRSTQKLLISTLDVEPETKESRDKGALAFKSRQIEEKLKAAKAEFLTFPDNSSTLPTESALALNTFTTGIKPVVTKELVDTGMKIYVYGKISSAEDSGLNKIKNATTGKNRAKAVVDFIESKLGLKGICHVVESFDKEAWIKADLERIMKANKASDKEIKDRAFKGAMIFMKDLGETGDKVGKDLKGLKRDYTVAVHEFGHMLGLPDEYLGVNCLELQKEIKLSASLPTTLQHLAQVVTDGDVGRKAQAKGFAELIKEGKVPAPVFLNSAGTVTTSIMYAGSDCLPAHYLTFWEALLTICFPYMWPDEWKIVPNSGGTGKKSNLKFFSTK